MVAQSGRTWLDWQASCIRGINLRDAARTCSVTRWRRIHCFGSSIRGTGNVPRSRCQHRGGGSRVPKEPRGSGAPEVARYFTKAKFGVSCSCHCVSVTLLRNLREQRKK